MKNLSAFSSLAFTPGGYFSSFEFELNVTLIHILSKAIVHEFIIFCVKASKGRGGKLRPLIFTTFRGQCLCSNKPF